MKNRIGVFLACTGIRDPEQALRVVKSLGLSVAQVGNLEERWYTPGGAREFSRLLRETGMEAPSTVIVHKGEKYTDWAAVRKTVGYLPAETLQQRLEHSRRVVDFATAIKSPIVTTHMGVLPRDTESVGYQRLQKTVTEVAEYCNSKGEILALETGQETSEQLTEFIERIPGEVKVNFDGANYVIYDTDDPLHAVDVLKDYIIGVHVKDGTFPGSPELLGGQPNLGEGTSRVDKWVSKIIYTGYQGPLVMEIYSGTDRIMELRKGMVYLQKLLEKI